ncbi:flagellar biosynthesis protein FlhF [Bacillus sp. FJAT-27264]|uniref:flagellar biosynthesis protein FlhF n=1 Tax=Paenibacillus sp. (strain DSM 101736 / FJAT-27264) TaxID=1850362 RepID=UPI00080812CF|nr:flagellar biosynthesis protein FlhF [Bacillus sp. FJAT-27264]OBZ18367.1 flagellar biosynthesis protein FlhF [Bacillus sp. FJAT-27264]
MRVKRYVVDTMPDAMLSIRNELGSDAVILSTKEIKVGGFIGLFQKKKIEVVAAVEKEQKPAAPAKPPAPSLSIPRNAVPQAYKKASATSQAPEEKPAPAENRTFAEIAAALSEAIGIQEAAVVPAPALRQEPPSPSGELRQTLLSQEPEFPLLNVDFKEEARRPALNEASAPDPEVLREIREMKQWMERIARHSSGTRDLPDRLEILRSQLVDQEMDTVLVEEWISTIFDRWNDEGRTWRPEQFDACLAEQISSFLSGRVAQGIRPDTQIVYIAGPTGVGKTTTIAKLAAEQLFKYGRRVGLITSDTYRISAVDQLRTYASILNIPLEVVQSPGDLQRAMFRLESCDLVLMDTAGRNYRNELLVAELQSLLAKELRSETYLVLSMTSKSRDMKKIAEHFGRYPLDKVIFTKLDETGSYGPLFNVLNDFPLTLSYLTNGQNVPDDLLLASEEELSDMLLGTGGY